MNCVFQKEFNTYTSVLRKKVPQKCKSCGNTYCLACGESISLDASSTDENECLFHCANLQGAILGVGLAMLEHAFLEEVQPSPHDENQKAKRRKVSAKCTPGTNDEDDDDAYPFPNIGGALVSRGTQKVRTGTGYAGHVKEDVSSLIALARGNAHDHPKMSGQIEALNIQRAKDTQLSLLLSQIRVFLPSVHREDGGKASDYLPHPTTLAHLRRRFNFVSSQLLRNDSLVDMSDRSILYFELFDWLEVSLILRDACP